MELLDVGWMLWRTNMRFSSPEITGLDRSDALLGINKWWFTCCPWLRKCLSCQMLEDGKWAIAKEQKLRGKVRDEPYLNRTCCQRQNAVKETLVSACAISLTLSPHELGCCLYNSPHFQGCSLVWQFSSCDRMSGYSLSKRNVREMPEGGAFCNKGWIKIWIKIR